MSTETTDANLVEQSSTSTAETAQQSTTQSTESSTVKTEQAASTEKPKTLREVAQAAFEKATETEGKAEEGGVPEKDTTDEEKEASKSEEGKEETSEKQKTDETEVEKTEEKKEELPPFHQHPRWQEKVKEVKELQTKFAEVETKLKEYEPMAQHHKQIVEYCQTNNISQQQFQEAMQFVAALNSNPAQARAMLEPVWKNLSSFDENTIPADLQARVTEGEISEAAAKEIAGYRAKQNAGQKTQQFSQQQQVQQTQKALNDSVSGWDSSKRSADPDFKPKAGVTAPDGLYELTAKGFAYLASTNPAATPQDVIKHLETAYNDAKATLKRLAPPTKPTPKVPSSSTASVGKQKEPKTIREVVARAAAGHGISMVS